MSTNTRLLDIKHLVAYYINKFHTRNPFEIADYLGIIYQIGDIGCDGCYMYLKKHRYIFLSQDLNDQMLRVVMAHELEHAILHRRENCYFIRHETFLSNSKIEKEANCFAAELLISDSLCKEYEGFTMENLAAIAEVPVKLMDFKR